MDDSVNAELDAVTFERDLMSNYLRMVVQPQNDLLELAMREYRLALAESLFALAA